MFLEDCFKKDVCLAIDWERIEQIPEMAELKNCQQSPKWHQEGNAWIHTQRVVDAAYVKSYDFSDFWVREKLIVSALFHDVGKCNTTFQDSKKPGVWHSYNHEYESERLVKEIFKEDDTIIIPLDTVTMVEDIAKIVRNHMAVLKLLDTKMPYENIIKMVNEVGGKENFDILVALKECDMKGSEPEDKIGQTADFLRLKEIQRIADVLYGEEVFNFTPHLKGEFDFEKYLKENGR